MESQFVKSLSQILKQAFSDNLKIMTEYSLDIGEGFRRHLDLAFEHPRLGLFVIEIKPYSIDSLSSVKNPHDWSLRNWPKSLLSPLEQSVIYVNALNQSRDKKLPIDQLHAMVALPNIRRHEWEQKKGLLDPNLINYIIFADDLSFDGIRFKIQYSQSVTSLQNFISIEDTKQPTKQYDIFISYRRDDSGWAAGRIYDRLVKEFGDKVFIDSQIELGKNWKKVLEECIASSNILLVIMGERWLTISDDVSGIRRLDSKDDIVKWEILSAIQENLKIIPIFIDKTKVPSKSHLPKQLGSLPDFNGHKIELIHFDSNMAELVDKLRKVLK